MEVKGYQESVDQWIKEYGVRYFKETTNMIVLMEEVGELSRLMARVYGEQSFKNKEEETVAKESIQDEIGDIFFVLTCLANQMDIDITEVLERNLNKKSKRDKDRHHSNQKLK